MRKYKKKVSHWIIHILIRKDIAEKTWIESKKEKKSSMQCEARCGCVCSRAYAFSDFQCLSFFFSSFHTQFWIHRIHCARAQSSCFLHMLVALCVWLSRIAFFVVLPFSASSSSTSFLRGYGRAFGMKKKKTLFSLLLFLLLFSVCSCVGLCVLADVDIFFQPEYELHTAQAKKMYRMKNKTGKKIVYFLFSFCRIATLRCWWMKKNKCKDDSLSSI